ncbi:MAG: hypothetical protein O2960_16250 [Verrucomicrobia bacterium]|nr:hypothetical protein [Verrucomicrobiota bacterium]
MDNPRSSASSNKSEIHEDGGAEKIAIAFDQTGHNILATFMKGFLDKTHRHQRQAMPVGSAKILQLRIRSETGGSE